MASELRVNKASPPAAGRDLTQYYVSLTAMDESEIVPFPAGRVAHAAIYYHPAPEVVDYDALTQLGVHIVDIAINGRPPTMPAVIKAYIEVTGDRDGSLITQRWYMLDTSASRYFAFVRHFYDAAWHNWAPLTREFDLWESFSGSDGGNTLVPDTTQAMEVELLGATYTINLPPPGDGLLDGRAIRFSDHRDTWKNATLTFMESASATPRNYTINGAPAPLVLDKTDAYAHRIMTLIYDEADNDWRLYSSPSDKPPGGTAFFTGERTIVQAGHPFTVGQLQAGTIEAGSALARASTASAATLQELDVIATDATTLRVFADWFYQPAHGRTPGSILFLDDAGDWQEDIKDPDFDAPRYSVFDGDWLIRQNWRPIAANAATPQDNHVVRADLEVPSLRETNVYPAGSTVGAAPAPDAAGAWYETILGTTAQHYFSRDGATWELVQGPQDELVTEVATRNALTGLATKIGQHGYVADQRTLYMQYKDPVTSLASWIYTGMKDNPTTVDSTDTVDQTDATIDATA